MPPCRPASAKATKVNDGASATSTPKRMTRSYRASHTTNTPGNASPSQDELSIEVEGTGSTAQARADPEVVMDEIVVSKTPKKAKANDVDVTGQTTKSGNSAESSRVLRRSSRTSSISQGGIVALSPSGRGVSMKKQDFPVGIAADDDGKPDELSDPPTAKKRKVEPKPVQRVAFRKSRSKWDNPDEMLTNPEAPLAEANLRDLLCSPKAWDILTREEKNNILARFPDGDEILDSGTPNARPDIAALRNNDNFRHDVARYQDGLSRGFHDAEWIQQAQAAHNSRELGFYDEFMAADFEERWGMTLPEQPPTRSGPNGNISRQASHTPDVEVNDAPIESGTIISSEQMVNQYQGRNGTAKIQSTDALQDLSAAVNVQDRKDNAEDTNKSNLEHVYHMSGDEGKKTDQPLGNDNIKARLAQAESVTTQKSTAEGGQMNEDRSHGVEIASIPSLPAVTERAEQELDRKSSEMTVAQRADIVEAAGKHEIAIAQDIINHTVTVDDISDMAQKHQDEETSSEVKATEHQQWR